VGQIERFQLRHGILLLDEPELHLNPDLLRNWVAFLRDTIVTGQVWISTHSLEAVEAAGPDSTFVLERAPDSRIVEGVSSLADRPVLSVLSAAVGSPAFSPRKLRFVYIEGDRRGREKERFYSLYGDSRFVRFIEGGGCAEVTKKLATVRELAEDADEQLRAGGAIDRDFRTDQQISELASKTPVYVLGCHEIENMFLHPEALQRIAERSGVAWTAIDAICRTADRFAGLWILHRAATVSGVVSAEARTLRRAGGILDWAAFVADKMAAINQIASAAFDRANPSYSALCNDLIDSANEYERV